MITLNKQINQKICKELCDLEEEILKLVVFQLSPALEARYLDFLKKYLQACLKIFPDSHKNSVKFCFLDFRRNIYYWIPLEVNEKITTQGKFVKEWTEIKTKLVKRIAGVVRHTFKNQQSKDQQAKINIIKKKPAL